MADLLVEIGTEELPPGEVGSAAAQLGRGMRAALEALRLSHGPITTYGTPRRLAVVIRKVADRQRPAERRVRGPAASSAFDQQGRPTQAALGFARSQGVPVSSLEVVEEPGGRRYVVAVLKETGRPAAEVLPEAIASVITGLSFAKTMRWGGGEMRFARPIRWLVALLGSVVLPLQISGVRAGRTTRGHRALAPGACRIGRPAEYAATLRAVGVVVDPQERRRRIESRARRLAAAAGGRLVLDPRLLDEVVMSTEHPFPLCGGFDPGFLALPREVLVTVMQHHQKYFPVEDDQGRLLPVFVAVRDGGPRHVATVRQGHEWVLGARLADARFFFDEDRRRRLEDYVPLLDGVTFLAPLGTMGDKTRRLVTLAGTLASLAGLDGRTTETLARAATLCKADLVTRMVGEFPELQGTVGRIYASLDGEPTEVARAIEEHYRPAGAGDSPPRTYVGALLGVIDKIDTLAGAIGAGLMPTGSQDPYGLRRAAQGIVEIVLMLRLRLAVKTLAHAALQPFERRDEDVAEALTEFLRQRLRTTLIERGIRYDVADAALAVSGDDLLAAADRAAALEAVVRRPEFIPLYVAYDRAARILTPDAAGPVDPALFEAPVEQTLFDTVRAVEPPVAEAAAAGDYLRALEGLRPLVAPVNQIFDDVLIMAPDERIRANRLALLRRVVGVFRHVADFARLVIREEEKAAAGGER
ncbi:MAG: glycine--tRNA ligase subunit beta [Armatimonadota bacterium]|nr:glycine--tRNA ligase subunit beta [Armatimonadota bacterium]MDR7451269.1 glycine--tRNA ligase subunit beta [Armatimonadota bacterium]MDR7466828.1 glycine--tRNA ligase subunit beta [Armatimonadota bacterium]MDR7492699.1 glycine--tRNA ligase subunit beta [Armatimonadota bacterium]MDR7499628.1 glycine--tRNA ligase subunit beta [Armatimonadota bacterium]